MESSEEKTMEECVQTGPSGESVNSATQYTVDQDRAEEEDMSGSTLFRTLAQKKGDSITNRRRT